MIPSFNDVSVCKVGIGHTNNFDDSTVQDFVEWIRNLGEWGYCYDPLEWK